ncbi:MAG: ATP-binding protein [Chlamydiales bacterium]
MEFEASLDSLPHMMEYIRQQAQLYGIQSSIINRIELSCEEAIVNIISYAYQKDPGQIEITCKKQGMRFEIRLCDLGPPFNPIDADIDPQFNIPIGERKIGGMGIFLIRKIIDEVSYRREGEVNILCLAFNLL